MTHIRDPIHEKPHRLPRDRYCGQVSVAFTACVENRLPLFTDGEVVVAALERLSGTAHKYDCNVLIYCFMPEHLHLITRGRSPDADAWQFVVAFKQQLGFWLGGNRPGFHCQKDFYDHIIRADEDLVAQIRYVAMNPVRRGLVKSWLDYPHTGAIGVDLIEILRDTASS
jgi:REP element-mobilizing transposase RayT